jgi:hypothetical protein
MNYIKDGDNVYFYPPDDENAFAVRSRHLLLHRDEELSVGKRG